MNAHLTYHQQNQPLPQGNLAVTASYTFSAKEKDSETSLSYFGARYYTSNLSIWLSVDPMSGKYPSLSPYTYCANNPVKLVDPNGEEIGNFYDIFGNYLGTDGIEDNEVYIVTDDADIEKIENNNKKGETTQVSEISSAMRLPLIETRKKMVYQVENGDKKNSFAEYGGIYGIDVNTKEEDIRPAKEGTTYNISESKNVTIDYNTANITFFTKIGTYHSHPSGNEKHSFDQHPSPKDYQNAINREQQYGMKGTNMVFGMKDKNVYLYNSKGNKATISLSIFLNIK